MVLGQGLRLAVIGTLIGTAGALASTRLMTHMLVGISAVDPIAFGGVIVVLVTVAVAASYVPARRASRAEPMDVLRGQ